MMVVVMMTPIMISLMILMMTLLIILFVLKILNEYGTDADGEVVDDDEDTDADDH